MDRIDALRFLLEIAEAGSFAKVARHRAVATSTVALAVSQLEEEFGTRLVTRTTRRLDFTHEGESMLSDAKRIVAVWDAALGGLKDGGPLSGPIRITATNDFGRRCLRPLLDLFQEQYPTIQIDLLLSDRNLDLVEERIDLAIRNGPLADSSLRAALLIRGPRLVCASPEYWNRAGRPAHPSELTKHNCIVLARPGAPLVAWPFREDGKLFHVKVKGDRQGSDGGMMRDWALEGRGVIIKNRWEIQRDLEEGRLETVLENYVAGQIDLHAVYSNPPNRRVAALVSFLIAAVRERLSGPECTTGH